MQQNRTLRHFIGVFDSAEADFLPALYPAHGLDDATEFVLFLELDWLVSWESTAAADFADICGGVVLAKWCPARNYRGYGVDGRATLDVVA